MKPDREVKLKSYTLISCGCNRDPINDWDIYPNRCGFNEVDIIDKYLTEAFKKPDEISGAGIFYKAYVFINNDWDRVLTYKYYVLEGEWRRKTFIEKVIYQISQLVNWKKSSKKEEFIFRYFAKE